MNPELVPLRRENNMADMLDFPLQEKVIFIDHTQLPNKEYMCDLDKWDLDLVRGRIVSFAPLWENAWRCSRPDYAIVMHNAGVRAWVHADGWRIHGVGRNIHLPIGTYDRTGLAFSLHDRFRKLGKKLNNYTYELELLFRVPPLPAINDTAAPVEYRAELTTDTSTKDLMEEPVAVVGVVTIVIMCIAITVQVVHNGITSVPLPAARGIPLGLSSTLLSASLAVVLAIVTFILADSAGKDAERAQRDNKEEAMKVMVVREERIVVELQDINLKAVANILSSIIESLRGRTNQLMYNANAVAAFDSVTYTTFTGETATAWRERIDMIQRLRVIKDDARYTTGMMIQVVMFNGWYWDEFGVENDFNSYMLNGTQRTLLETNQPFLHPLQINDTSANGRGVVQFEPSLHNPLKRLFLSELPSVFEDTVQMTNGNTHGVGSWGMLYIGEYQVIPITSAVSDDKINGPYLAEARWIKLADSASQGAVFIGIPLQRVGSALQASIRDRRSQIALTENMTFAVVNHEGLIIGNDIEVTLQSRVVDHYGKLLLNHGTQRGYQLFTVFDTNDWRFNAYAHFLLKEYGRLDAKSPEGAVIVDTFRARDYYRGYRTEWLWFPFDGAVGEAGWHVWDAWMECEGGGLGCFRFDEGRDGRGQALYLDGTGAVRVSPYLTQRVPRVARRRVGGVAGYQSTLDYYNHSMPWGGVGDVIVTQRNARPSVQGERWEPVVREKVFMRNDYSVSVWVKRSQAGGKGIIFADSLTPDTNLRVYEDGSVVISIVSYGCRTAAVRNLPVGEWVFLTATVHFARANSLGYCAMYVDGVRRTKSPMGERAPMSGVVQNYSIGHKYTGHIDDLRVHNKTLSVEQVQELMRTGDARWIPDQVLTAALLTSFQHRENYYGNYYSYMVILPQEDIVRESKANAAKMMSVVEEQDKATQDNLDRRTKATWLLVTGILLVGVLVFVMYNAVLARPFAQFARDISLVSYIDVGAISPYPANSSPLREINVMRSAMNVLVSNMKTFKSFMPIAMRETVAAKDITEDDLSDTSAISLSQSRKSTASNSHSSSLFITATRMLQQSLAPKKMGFLLVNLVDFHKGAVRGREANTLELHANYITHLVETACAYRGVPETFSGDRILVTYNGVKISNSFRDCALGTGLALVKGIQKIGMAISAAAVAGTVLAGHMGTESMMRYSTLGPCVSWLYHMERYARQHDIPFLTDTSIFEACANQAEFRHVAVFDTKQAPYITPVILTAVYKEIAAAVDEWMYQLEEANKHSYAAWNAILVSLMHREWDQALAALKTLPDTDVSKEACEEVGLLASRRSLARCCQSILCCGQHRPHIDGTG